MSEYHSPEDSNNQIKVNDNEQQQQVEEEGKIPERWKNLLMNIGSVVPLIMGIIFFNKCPSIPDAHIFAITFGCLSAVRGAVQFIFDIPLSPEKQDKTAMSTHAFSFLGIAQLGLGFWAAGITFGKAQSFWKGELDCENPLFYCTFVPGAIMVSIVAGSIIYAIYRVCTKKKESEEEGTILDAKSVEHQEPTTSVSVEQS